MTHPRPALEQLATTTAAPWVRTYQLQNEDGSDIDGTRLLALLEFWDEPRQVLYGAADLVWDSRDPAQITATLAVPVLDDGRVVILRQYRFAVATRLLDLRMKLAG